ncbi:sigma-70 family RNA polymerase sigma factor [Enterocloster aldensis]|uniref:Sigma-70 family RNA polymerase sigma factor n=2 Tax=Enterocloster aldenensis TaxID=358742 RepID=A0ABX2HIY2_9FIRM|nr:sigma-70 family RNA polymerase sigma factor [Enterocloster citroniae]MBS1460739.1 sigma-70 family RNA polymerase sigma factor [Clostridium sp.]MBS5628968.1 sigma-70 family RNA polymerase sigma factor [Clostridiales bacterium]MCC3398243.1 sigma-70 family RNA polymerase sigma factor [Clostridiales bacterium AHG0011]NSJ49400.1 sigma-70 family RNA polymerase sigma factor [Enterocloster aldenensis]RGC55747.1 sigma-70 family RNA polymerase sigma factor [Dorea longicatena]
MHCMGFQNNTAETEQILTENYERYYRLAYSYMRNEDDALDVVQESAYRAIRDCRKVRNKDYLSTWIYRIVVNTALDMLRRKKKENITEELPEIPVEDQYQDLELRTVLNQLDDKSRTIILLRYFEDLKLEDIADIVGDNLNTVKARLYRSLKKLRLNLEAEHYREIPDKS